MMESGAHEKGDDVPICFPRKRAITDEANEIRAVIEGKLFYNFFLTARWMSLSHCVRSPSRQADRDGKGRDAVLSFFSLPRSYE